MPLGLSAPHNERRLWRSHYVGALRGDDRGGHRHHEALGGGAQGLHATANEADHPYAEAYPQIHPSGLLFVSVQIPQCSQHRAMLCMLCSALLCLSLLCLWLFGLITLLCLFVVEAWIRTSLANYGLQLEDFHLFVSDGASNGTKALYPCALHTIFRCPHHTPLAMAVRCARPHCHSPCLASPLTPVLLLCACAGQQEPRDQGPRAQELAHRGSSSHVDENDQDTPIGPGRPWRTRKVRTICAPLHTRNRWLTIAYPHSKTIGVATGAKARWSGKIICSRRNVIIMNGVDRAFTGKSQGEFVFH